ncbi:MULTISPECIES: helix-turn-helix domain-containing protein [Paenibacillus]|uniref:helix-turn-helix domain-containing protein n=1 Tax=Paenibacillus TaxID=44249 RepID=UPI00096C0E0D|nr:MULTISPECIES: helix-turn-helix transcriptional regulator [Paenibacillus]OMD26825.1 transcriptional regulator [Paenibacillus odorifer]OME15293.1 transcriptional regulator [Paenibacillus odorifer]OMF89802.1 transcriptional regulator [Paenibacillus sp. FSL R7-0337]
MKLHNKIRDIRKSKGVTQTFVAKQTGMTISNYNMKENGKRPISTVELEIIAAVLKEPVVNFFN